MLGVYEFIFKSIPQKNGGFKYSLGKDGEGHNFKVLAESYEHSIIEAKIQLNGMIDCLNNLNQYTENGISKNIIITPEQLKWTEENDRSVKEYIDKLDKNEINTTIIRSLKTLK